MTNNNRFPQFKAGDTFSFVGNCRLPDGIWTATCQIRTTAEPHALVGTVDVTLGTQVGADTPLVLHADATVTAAWPPGTHELDIRYADQDGIVVHTSTLLLPVVRAVTGA